VNNPHVINEAVEQAEVTIRLIKTYTDYVFYDDGEYRPLILDEFVSKLEEQVDKIRSQIR
jgi:hypothetical protein